MSANKHVKHICKNCFWFLYMGTKGLCFNSNWPNDIRVKKPNDICDGGGIGANDYGFRPDEDLPNE